MSLQFNIGATTLTFSSFLVPLVSTGMHSVSFIPAFLVTSFQLLEPTFLLNLTSHSAWVGFSLCYLPLTQGNLPSRMCLKALYKILCTVFWFLHGMSNLNNCLLYIYGWKCNCGSNTSCLSQRYKFGGHLFKDQWESMDFFYYYNYKNANKI